MPSPLLPLEQIEISEQYFGHHPLELCEDKILNEEHTPYLCSLCELPVLSTPSYRSSDGCNVFLHKPCVHLPKEVNSPLDSIPLFLKQKPPHGSSSDCRRCGKLCTNFVYSSDSGDDIFHPLCATPVDIKIEHESHTQHPLVAVSKVIVTRCDACGETQDGLFFSCQECNFWIHQDCASLPSIVKPKAHDHLLVLTYVFSHVYHISMPCQMCSRRFHGKGVYACSECRYCAHLGCATSNMEKLTSGQGFIHLPDENDTFPSLTIHVLGNKRFTEDINEANKLTMGKYHNHPLIFHDSSKHDHQSSSSSSSSSSSTSTQSLCNACIQPIISSPFWGCIRSDCYFVLHDLCANIPSNIISLRRPAFLRPDFIKDYFFHSTFPCFLCSRPCNGFGYWDGLFSKALEIPVLCDVECSSTPNAITHASHGRHHVLFLMVQRKGTQMETKPPSCCPNQSEHTQLYSCVTCDFAIHVGCALLPKKVRHKFDKHPLELTFTSHEDGGIDKSDDYFCEFCEEDIDRSYWFYYCAECDQYFHVKCIPSVGLLSKVKFGGTTNVSCHPRHPVTLTRMLMEGNQRCGYCERIIKGFVDEMAFYCEECEFWIHFSCARDCNSDGSYVLWYECMSAIHEYFIRIKRQLTTLYGSKD